MAKERHVVDLLANPDVHGVGVGRRRRDGKKTDEYAVVVHLRHKVATEDVPESRLIPRNVTVTLPDGHQVTVPIDVQEKAPPVDENVPAKHPLTLADRIRPVPGGVGVGLDGTLGGGVWDTVTAQVVALSNKHVFGRHVGDPVLQPSRSDGGLLPADLFATVLRVGSLDAAVATPVNPSVVALTVAGGGAAVFAIAAASIDMRVQKTGRGSGLTHGVVDLIDFASEHDGSQSDLWIDGDGEDFSAGGDSGSIYLVVDPGTTDPPPAVGLHWGGSGRDGVGHHIGDVFEDLGVTVLPGPTS